jgi:sugar-specific transcriptional regulator TrmB
MNLSQKKVIEAIISLKSATTGRIAQTTGMHRQSVRIILESLTKNGFISGRFNGNQIVYSHNDLDGLKRKSLNGILALKDEIPKLRADYEDTKDTQVINAVTGVLGLRSVLMDEVLKGKEICAFHLSRRREEYEREFMANDKRRAKQKIFLRMLRNQEGRKIPLANIKNTRLQSKVDIYVYANKVTLFYNVSDAKVFTIKINEITRFFKDVFEEKWKN